MVDHVRTLLINPPSSDGYVRVADPEADAVLALLGATGTDLDAALVDRLLPLALAPDLAWARDVFDPRTRPTSGERSVYRMSYEASDPSGRTVSLALDGVHGKLLGTEGWWTVQRLFTHPDPVVRARLSDLRDAAMGKDGAYALGAVLLACAYRRHVLQGGDAVALGV